MPPLERVQLTVCMPVARVQPPFIAIAANAGAHQPLVRGAGVHFLQAPPQPAPRCLQGQQRPAARLHRSVAASSCATDMHTAAPDPFSIDLGACAALQASGGLAGTLTAHSCRSPLHTQSTTFGGAPAGGVYSGVGTSSLGSDHRVRVDQYLRVRCPACQRQALRCLHLCPSLSR